MCGICGVYEYGTRAPVDENVLRGMLASIQHRGPDDEGIYLDDGVGLGNRRLSIIDLAGGKQPVWNEDRSVVVVYNGEMYNYPEVANELRQRGHTLASDCDTELIPHLYEEKGIKCVDDMRAMFGFALWDTSRKRLMLARDRLGVKPLYYADVGGRLVFGSEIKAILQHPAVEARLNMEALSNFLSLKYAPAPQTMFEGIHALPPGYLLTCDHRGVNVEQYWDVSYAQSANGRMSEADYTDQLEELLRDAVRSQLVSDVPFGAFLSGGVDSSTIVALMSQFLDTPVRTFSVGFEGPGESHSELPYARMVAERFETDHHEVFIRANDLIELADKVVYHLDQPIADEAVLANYMVSELASRHVKMVLTGEGGDELFAGYARYAGERLSPLFKAMPEPAKRAALGVAMRTPGLRRAKIAMFALSQSNDVDRIANWFPLFNQEAKSELLSSASKSALNGASTSDVFGEHLERADAKDTLGRMLYVDTKLWLPDDLLARGDKTSMAVSLEARVPLLDHKLVEFAGSLPSHLKLHRMTRKYLLKQVSRKWLPTEIVDRSKKGFPIPMSLWFQNEAKEFLHDHISPDTVAKRGLFDGDYVARLLREHDSGFADHGSLLWGLLSVELWQRRFLDGKPADNNVRQSSPLVSSGTTA